MSYDFSPGRWMGCWVRPEPESVKAAFVRLQNGQNYDVRKRLAQASDEPAVLALSSEDFRTPYGAGLLVGWGETGRRPDFAVVSAVGFSALLAPFAFVGPDGDQKLADVFNCEASSWREIAQHAAGLIDLPMIEKIAHKTRAGGQLWVALPGNAARPETVWNLGAIAMSGRPDAATLIGDIIVAAVTLTEFVDTRKYPAFGYSAKKNFTFRNVGAGEPFLLPGNRQRRWSSYFLVHSYPLAPDESAKYIAQRRRKEDDRVERTSAPLVAAYDVERAARESHARFQIAFSPYEPSLEDVPAKDFDMDFMRRLFAKSYWIGVQGDGWQAGLPGNR